MAETRDDWSKVEVAKAGPALTSDVYEVQAAFATDDALQEAIALLAQARFDRSDLSLPQAAPAGAVATPDQGAETPTTDTDMRQARTMGTSMAGTAGAFAAAGITVATGGAAAVVIGAAVAAGAIAGGGAFAIGEAAESNQTHQREAAAERGELLLSARVTTPERRELAERLMKQAGGRAVEDVTRDAEGVSHETAAGGIDSASWTG